MSASFVAATNAASLPPIPCANAGSIAVASGRQDDGFAGEDEGTFAICTLWLCTALLQIGDLPAARELFDRVVGCANDLGLLAEELTPDGEQLGNYPQALTHAALVQGALAIRDAALGARTGTAADVSGRRTRR